MGFMRLLLLGRNSYWNYILQECHMLTSSMLRNWKIWEVHLQNSLLVFTCFQSSGFMFIHLQLMKSVLEHISWADCPSLGIWLSTVFLAWLLGSIVFYFYSVPAGTENLFWLIFSLIFIRFTLCFLDMICCK